MFEWKRYGGAESREKANAERNITVTFQSDQSWASRRPSARWVRVSKGEDHWVATGKTREIEGYN
jgi:hypothetical protein